MSLCSPFKIKALPAHDASKVRASGPGLNASGVPASLPVEFTIDARDAGEGLLTVQILVSEFDQQRPCFYLPLTYTFIRVEQKKNYNSHVTLLTPSSLPCPLTCARVT